MWPGWCRLLGAVVAAGCGAAGVRAPAALAADCWIGLGGDEGVSPTVVRLIGAYVAWWWEQRRGGATLRIAYP